MKPTQLDSMHFLESGPIEFPFCKEVPAGVVIATVQAYCVLMRGVDASPSSIMAGQPAISAGDSKVFQWVSNLHAGCSYLLLMEATLSNGQVLVRAGVLNVIEFKTGSGV